MGWNDHYTEEDRACDNFLQSLIDDGCLEGAALGITKKVISGERRELSDKQEYVFQTEVLDKYTVKQCKHCKVEIPWIEMNFAVDNDGYCPHCVHFMNKED